MESNDAPNDERKHFATNLSERQRLASKNTASCGNDVDESGGDGEFGAKAAQFKLQHGAKRKNVSRVGFWLLGEFALLFACTFAALAVLSAMLMAPAGTAASRQVAISGDILLGGLFPIHAGGSVAPQCGRIKADQGVQRMVAMLYALDWINRNEGILPGIRLGAQILDTCSVETHALEQSLVFIKTVMSTSDRTTCSESAAPASFQRRQPVAAVVGAASSQVSVMVASMLQLFKIPMLSYSSTGVELSEKPRFAYFSRVVPPDNLQAKAMAHLVAELEWNYVHAIGDTGSYGERGLDSFRAAATKRGICIDGSVHKISRRWTDEQFEELLLRMRHSNKARGVVMFVDEDNLRRFLAILKRMITSGLHSQLRNYFWFVASDSWGMKTSVIKGFEQIANGAITITPKVRFLKGFNEYFSALGPVNTFLSEYWQSLNCSSRINENFGKCFASVNLSFKQEAYVPFVFDAVKLIARALHRYIQEDCGNLRKISWFECKVSRMGFEGFKLQSMYRNVSLNANEPPLIDANGDGIGQYNIFQLDRSGIYNLVGRWLAGNELQLNLSKVRQGLREVDGSKAFPVSVCSWPCRHGYYRAYQDQSCCWTCIPCDITTSIILNETSCIQCELGFVPNANLSACRPIEPVYLQWTSAWALLPAVFAFCGIVATTFVTIIFLRNNDTPVVMASSRELCYCMLSGIGLCYVMTFILLARPNVYACALSRVLIGVSMAAIYAAILVKTNRVARVFKPSSAVRPRFISPSSQVAICVMIVSVQFFGSSIWLIVDPPGITIQYPTRIEAVLTCKATGSHFLTSLLFNMLLILACTIYAFKTRKIPENFNETRLIGFTMYSTCILWLAFGPIYFATQNNFKIQITSLCMCISMSGSVALACIFAPKVYIVLWQPYKNVRTRNSAVGRLVNQQMRFIRCAVTNDKSRNCQMSTNSAQSLPSGALSSGATVFSSVVHKKSSFTVQQNNANGPGSVDSAYVTVTGTGSPPNGGTALSSTATQFDELISNTPPMTTLYGATTTTTTIVPTAATKVPSSARKTSGHNDSFRQSITSEASIVAVNRISDFLAHANHHQQHPSAAAVTATQPQPRRKSDNGRGVRQPYRRSSPERRSSTLARDDSALSRQQTMKSTTSQMTTKQQQKQGVNRRKSSARRASEATDDDDEMKRTVAQAANNKTSPRKSDFDNKTFEDEQQKTIYDLREDKIYISSGNGNADYKSLCYGSEFIDEDSRRDSVTRMTMDDNGAMKLNVSGFQNIVSIPGDTIFEKKALRDEDFLLVDIDADEETPERRTTKTTITTTKRRYSKKTRKKLKATNANNRVDYYDRINDDSSSSSGSGSRTGSSTVSSASSVTEQQQLCDGVSNNSAIQLILGDMNDETLVTFL